MGRIINEKQPVFPIGIVAKMIGVSQATLRIWERRGLIRPGRLGKDRFYSHADVDRLRQIKCLLQEKGLNLAGVAEVLNTRKCWEIKNCPEENRRSCPVYQLIAS